MSKVWVLDTETKGTGAEMVPLEKVERDPASRPARRLPVSRKPPARAAKPPASSPPRQFTVVEVVTGRVLAEGVGTRAAVEVLDRMRSVVDVSIYVWEENAGKWRSLTLDERRGLWALRGRRPGDFPSRSSRVVDEEVVTDQGPPAGRGA